MNTMIISNFKSQFNRDCATIEEIQFRKQHSRYSMKLLHAKIKCPFCESDDAWAIHAHYLRRFYINGIRIKVRICRFICKECNHTHAILFDRMVPFNSLPYESTSLLSSQLETLPGSFLRLTQLYEKYSFHQICVHFSRSLKLIFLPTQHDFSIS